MNHNPLNHPHESDPDAFEQMFHRSLQRHGLIFPDSEEDIEALRQRVVASPAPAPDNLPSAEEIVKHGWTKRFKGWRFAPQADAASTITWGSLLQKLKGVGFSEPFITKRLLPKGARGFFATSRPSAFDSHALTDALWRIAKIFELSPEEVVRLEVLPVGPVAGTAYKKPSNSEASALEPYTRYAKALAAILAKASQHLPVKSIPADYAAFRSAVVSSHGKVNFEGTLRYVWSLGIPVLPLKDQANFHGACFLIGDRSVIVLKQNTPSQIRWLFDLLHEVKHASDQQKKVSWDVVESNALFSNTMKLTPEEKAANQFASDVVLNGKGNELAFRIVTEAGSELTRFKRKVVEVAKRENVEAGALANHLAYLLTSQQKVNWWGTATNLQTQDTDPYAIALRVLEEYYRRDALDEDEADWLTNSFV
jgi:hypothetical protein